MNFFKTFRTYLNSPSNIKSQDRSSGSFEQIVSDIIDLQEEANSDAFQDLIYEEQQHQQIQNMYMKDFIFVNKLTQAKKLSDQQWMNMIKSGNLSLFPKKNIYFSILKGISFNVRKHIWQLFANISDMKKLTKKNYKQLIDPQNIKQEDVTQIDKDVPRSKSTTKHLKQLRNILIAYCAISGNNYTQGMNLIAGALLSLLALENDEQLKQFQIFQAQFEQRVFWVFIGVMIFKRWQDIFYKNLQGLTSRLKVLQMLLIEHLPAVYQKIIDFEWDLTIFSQYYITIMLYNTPLEFSKIILDLFFIDGQNALHSLIIRMMKMKQDKILGFMDQCQLMMYFKRDLIIDCYQSVKKNQIDADKLEDFQINFIKSVKN